MSKQPGLRFDIYERITLSEDMEPIMELDGVELIPHIEVSEEGEYSVVRGSLQLEGSYACDNEMRSTVALQHTIPIEITLPMNRVSNVEQISVEIDNLDVDLLSSRCLNVTGVLSLHGIEMSSNTATEAWREEEVLFVHQAEAEAEPEPAGLAETDTQQQQSFELDDDDDDDDGDTADPWAIEVPAVKYEELEGLEHDRDWLASNPVNEMKLQSVYSVEREATVSMNQVPVSPQEAWSGLQSPASASKPREEILVDTYEDLTLLDQYESDQGQIEMEHEEGIAEHNKPNIDDDDDEDEEQQVEAARDQEMKIAIGSVRRGDSPSNEIKSFLHKNDTSPRSANEHGTKFSASRNIVVEEPAQSEIVEWKKLFLASSEEQKFKKVRIAIIQKEETLETIAKRYDRKALEIKLYNKLEEQEVSAGQILYIP